MTEPAAAPNPPRLAATILLVRDDPFEVLMVRRAARKEDRFASAMVFPGGVVDPEDRSEAWRDHVDGSDALSEDERALRIAGCRETFEEAGILLATGPNGVCPVPGAPIGGASFLDLIRGLGARLQLDAFAHFTHWVTPEGAFARFDTHFLLARAPDGAEAQCDGGETVALEWTSPQDALARAAAGERRIVFPTRVNLQRLAESHDVAGALAAAYARPRFTVIPQPERQPDGRLRVTLPEAAGYGPVEEWR